MTSKKPSLTISQILIFAAVLAFPGTAIASGPVEQVLYSFAGGTDGNNPDGGLVADSLGNLYGTTTWGGPDSITPYGTVYELTPPAVAGGAWTKTVLYSFQGGANDGSTPFGTLIFDKLGNLYGTTQAGGPGNAGTVFELSPPAVPGNPWTETVLFIFPGDQSQGYWPFGKLTFDGIGNLYGTTEYGGSGKSGASCQMEGCGTRSPTEAACRSRRCLDGVGLVQLWIVRTRRGRTGARRSLVSRLFVRHDPKRRHYRQRLSLSAGAGPGNLE